MLLALPMYRLGIPTYVTVDTSVVDPDPEHILKQQGLDPDPHGSGTRNIQSWIRIQNKSFWIHNTGGYAQIEKQCVTSDT